MDSLKTKAFGRGNLWVAIAAVAFSLVVALGFGVPAQASAAEGGVGLAAGSTQVTTQDDVEMINPDWVSLWAGCPQSTGPYAFLSGSTDGIKVTNVVSSNSSILKVKKINSENNLWSYEIYPLKAGKVKLSITISQNGASKTLSETFTVKTFTNGISSMTLNGKSLAVPTSKSPVTEDQVFGFKGTSATLSIKAANGWEVMNISGYVYKQGSDGKSVEITNGKAFTIPKDCQASINVNLYNSGSGDSFYYYVSVNRFNPLTLVDKPTYYIGYPKTIMPRISMVYGGMDDIKVISVKSSKSSVISAKSNKLITKVALQPKKAGKSKITIKYKFKGKTYTASTMCTVSKDYPVKSVSVNGKSINLKKSSYGYSPDKYKKSSSKFKIAAAKGWKIKSLKCYNGYNDTKGKTVKNGKSVKTPKGQTTIVVATLKKGKATFTYSLYFNRA